MKKIEYNVLILCQGMGPKGNLLYNGAEIRWLRTFSEPTTLITMGVSKGFKFSLPFI